MQATAFDKVNAAAERYGLTLSDLEPAFRAGKLQEDAGKLYEDFTLLTARGYTAAAVLQRMYGVVIEKAEDGSMAVKDWGSGFGKLIHDAITTGTALPKTLEPLVRQMITLGLITRDDGTKFETLEDTGLSFTDTLTQGFQDVVDTLGELVYSIKVGLGVALTVAEQKAHALRVALENLPAGVKVSVATDIVDGLFSVLTPAATASTGGRVTGFGIQHFGMGGTVLPWRGRGTDTVPAMLTPGELVLNANQQRAVAALLRNGGGEGPQVHVHIEGGFLVDGPSVKRALDKYVWPQLPGAILRDANGERRAIKRTASSAA